MRVRCLRLFPIFLMMLLPGCAGLQGFDLSGILSMGRPLDEATVAKGLRQALDVGMQRTTKELSAPGGFADDPDVRIELPRQLRGLASSLREVGLGDKVDEFEASMNLAAEQAAAQALPIFSSAIASISLEDAFSILKGPDDAATRYLEAQTSDSLQAAFRPAIESAMRDVGLFQAYLEIVELYDAIPFSRLPKLDLEDYVADKTMKGLFEELAKEEARIRQDPAARSTALLRRVFGSVERPVSAPGEAAKASWSDDSRRGPLCGILSARHAGEETPCRPCSNSRVIRSG